MKKDKKWFIDKLTKERNKTDVHDPMYHFINEFIADAEQLDEPEVLSQEWIDRNKEPFHHFETKKVDYYVSTGFLQSLLISKKELPVIPKFVSEWIEETKEKGYPLAYAINSSKGELGEWLHDCDTDIETEENQEMFAEAWMGGYEIEEEPLYYAMVKGHELLGDVAKYWAHNKYDLEDLFISYETRDDSPIVVKNTKNHWDDLGINDSNANFIKAEDME